MENKVLDFVAADKAPGVIMIDGHAYGETGGIRFPVLGALRIHGGEYLCWAVPFCDKKAAEGKADNE